MSVLTGHTGEQRMIHDTEWASGRDVEFAPMYVPPPVHMLGERGDMEGDHSPAPIYEAAAAPLNQFRYGPAYTRWMNNLPRPSVLSFAVLHRSRQARFMKDTRELLHPDDADWLVNTVMELLNSAEPTARREIISAPYKEWLRGDGNGGRRIPTIAAALRRAFGADRPGSLIRSDKGPHPTQVWRTIVGSRWLLLVERTKLVPHVPAARPAPPDTSAKPVSHGRMTAVRVIEVATYTDIADAEAILNEFSAVEAVRAGDVADYCQATPAERDMLNRTANRANVQSDYDLSRLILRHRYPPRPNALKRAATALQGMAGKLLHRAGLKTS